MRRKIKKIKDKTIELSKDRNIRMSTMSLLVGFLMGFLSYKLMNYVPNNYYILAGFAVFTIVYKNSVVSYFKIDEKGWAFGHIYWPMYISWFATWTFLINM